MLDALSSLQDFALLALRVAAGGLMVVHGLPKLGGQRAAMKEGMKRIGVPGLVFDLVALNEVLGGIALLAGFLTRIAALLLALEMVGTIILYNTRLWKAPLPRGFLEPAFKQTHGYIGGWELDTLVLAACLVLLSLGPGLASLDHLLGL